MARSRSGMLINTVAAECPASSVMQSKNREIRTDAEVGDRTRKPSHRVAGAVAGRRIGPGVYVARTRLGDRDRTTKLLYLR